MALSLNLCKTWLPCAKSLIAIKTQLASQTIIPVCYKKTKCVKYPGPRCDEKNLKDNQCNKDIKAGKQKQSTKSMLYNPDCCLDFCKDMLPRFDDLYYNISDKKKREYQQTWIECPKLKIVKKPICKFEKLKTLAPLKRRKNISKEAPKTACSMANKDSDLLKCQEKPKGPCPRITLPGCRRARSKVTCVIWPKPSNCVKICAPYPAFSECQHDKIIPARGIECRCLDLPTTCDIYRAFHRMKRASDGKM